MFTTFVGTPQSLTGKNTSENAGSTLDATRNVLKLKPKRQQVSRACNWCRVNRVKCDNSIPCNNCRTRGRKCSNRDLTKACTPDHAHQEVEKLKKRVKELEQQLKDQPNSLNVRRQNVVASVPTPTASTASTGGLSLTDLDFIWDRVSNKKSWDGVYTSIAHFSQKTWYGPSSLFYFIARMNSYLALAFQQRHLDENIQLNSVATTLPTPDYSLRSDGQESYHGPSKPSNPEEFLTPTQEEYFLNLYWQSYHSSFLILNEVKFKEHYRSLWTTPGQPRKPSALVDIVIAMSMQYGMASIPRAERGGSPGSVMDIDDPTVAGRWYYRRCQSLLINELENPTISTLQCQILLVMYLCCASFHNMAYGILALAVRTAQMLGLHYEPPDTMSLAEKELRKRVYWSLYMFESKVSMKLGRPFSLSLSSTSCTLPRDDHNVAMLAGSDFSPLGEKVTWLSYNLYNIKLLLTARAVHTALYEKYSEVYNKNEGRAVYKDLSGLEQCAELLATSIKAFDIWIEAVPGALKTKRKNNGAPFSTDNSPLAVEQFAPLWLQRQRLLLELLYHNLAMNLYRSFVTFPSAFPLSSPLPSPPPTPFTQLHSKSAINHATAVTRIMHQILSETDILAGWHEAFQWQWGAALTLAGYLIANPTSDSAGDIRETIDRAVGVFEIFGRSFAVANSAAAVIRELETKADLLASRATGDDQVQGSHYTASGSTTGDGTGVISDNRETIDMNGQNEVLAATMQNYLTMDATLPIDSSNNLEVLLPIMENMSGELWYNFGAG
ncbi:fungal-specific transcription factor domain-containing protein [Camillea tinctor]|nr:fungal-specific transcription factor domain-containing protein [Camillea tinctor]